MHSNSPSSTVDSGLAASLRNLGVHARGLRGINSLLVAIAASMFERVVLAESGDVKPALATLALSGTDGVHRECS